MNENWLEVTNTVTSLPRDTRIKLKYLTPEGKFVVELGTVISAVNWKDSRGNDWYVEIQVDRTGYVYHKEGSDKLGEFQIFQDVGYPLGSIQNVLSHIPDDMTLAEWEAS